MKRFFVYMILCGDNTLYTGYTTDIKKRFKAHCDNKGAKYTRGRGNLKLVYTEELETKSLAMKREYEIKKMKRSEKESLINIKWNILLKLYLL